MNSTHEVTFSWALRLTNPLPEPEPNCYTTAAHGVFANASEEVLRLVSGFLELLVMSLPDGDPWRQVSARTSRPAAGRCLLTTPGVVCDDGSRVDFPGEELAGTPVLSGAAGTLLAAAGAGGWREVLRSVKALQAHLLYTSHSDALTGMLVADAIGEAIVWLRERRDSYGAGDYLDILGAWWVAASVGGLTDPPIIDCVLTGLTDQYAVVDHWV
jgi:hypothetical protein